MRVCSPGTCFCLRSLTRRRQDSKAEPRVRVFCSRSLTRRRQDSKAEPRGRVFFSRSLTRRRQDSKAEPRGFHLIHGFIDSFSDQLILGDVQHPAQSKHPETKQASGNTSGKKASIRNTILPTAILPSEYNTSNRIQYFHQIRRLPSD